MYRFLRTLKSLIVLSFCWGASIACAENVALVGVFPGKAVVVIDGGSPRTLAVGQSAGGVKVVSVEQNAAVLEVGGKRNRVRVGESPVSLSGEGSNGGQVVLSADAQGHFLANGAINSASVRFLVDTGASSVSMGPSVATKAGVNYLKGVPILSSTANGTVQAWRVNLETVTLGGMTLRNIEGVVMPQDMPVVLLGMSVLNRLEMKRDGVSMTLRQRY